MKSRLVIAVLVAWLSACAVPGGHHDPNAAPDDPLADTAAKRNDVHLSLIRDMIAKHQYYAALAHIEDEQNTVGHEDDDLQLLEADTRRELGQSERAKALYQALLQTPLRGQAEHGLGLLEARNGQLPQAIDALRRAASLLPTDVDIRNDLGYALMQVGNYDAAMPQLSTAAELAPNQMRSRNNLIILMYLMGRDTAAEQLAQRSGLDASALARLRGDARSIQLRRSGTAVSSSAAG